MDEHGETTDAGVTGSFSGSPSGSTTQQLLDLIWSGSLRQRQRAAQLLDVARKYPNFPIILEAVRECLQDMYDLQIGRAHV